MNYELRFSKEAETCIDEQLAWYEADESHGGVELADRWFARLQEAFIPLTENPMRHGFAPENGRWLPHLELRQMRFQPWKGNSVWRVLYVIDEDAKSLSVMQIRHARRPFLFEEEKLTNAMLRVPTKTKRAESSPTPKTSPPSASTPS